VIFVRRKRESPFTYGTSMLEALDEVELVERRFARRTVE
jgi:hypothetical protein